MAERKNPFVCDNGCADPRASSPYWRPIRICRPRGMDPMLPVVSLTEIPFCHCKGAFYKGYARGGRRFFNNRNSRPVKIRLFPACPLRDFWACPSICLDASSRIGSQTLVKEPGRSSKTEYLSFGGASVSFGASKSGQPAASISSSLKTHNGVWDRPFFFPIVIPAPPNSVPLPWRQSRRPPRRLRSGADFSPGYPLLQTPRESPCAYFRQF